MAWLTWHSHCIYPSELMGMWPHCDLGFIPNLRTDRFIHSHCDPRYMNAERGRYRGAFHCASATFKAEGAGAFYKVLLTTKKWPKKIQKNTKCDDMIKIILGFQCLLPPSRLLEHLPLALIWADQEGLQRPLHQVKVKVTKIWNEGFNGFSFSHKFVSSFSSCNKDCWTVIREVPLFQIICYLELCQRGEGGVRNPC